MGTGVSAKIRGKFGYDFQLILRGLSERFAESHPTKHMDDKSSIIEKKILPYFGDKRVRDVKPVDVLHWQNTIMETTNENGTPYSPVYLKTIHNQLNAMLNHAVRFDGLSENPAAKVGNMGKEKCGEVLVWTKDEYMQFIETLSDKPTSFYAFETETVTNFV